MNTKVWAHRGASGYAPENTLESFRLAVKMGADGIELDVRLTKDNQMVVSHDESIHRVSNGNGFIRDYTLSELKKFNFNRLHAEYEFTPIATLEEVLGELKDTALSINIEIKGGVYVYNNLEEKVLELVKQMKMEDRILYSSFNHYSMLRIKEINPEAKTGLLYEDGFVDVPQYGKRIGADALHPTFKNLKYPNLAEDCKELGLLLNVWTVNSEKDIRYVCECGVSGVITNYPDRARKIIDLLNTGDKNE
ncbi:MAG: glycerophosphodiester phosphodiesterase [Mobilitalea sp.]